MSGHVKLLAWAVSARCGHCGALSSIEVQGLAEPNAMIRWVESFERAHVFCAPPKPAKAKRKAAKP